MAVADAQQGINEINAHDTRTHTHTHTHTHTRGHPWIQGLLRSGRCLRPELTKEIQSEQTLLEQNMQKLCGVTVAHARDTKQRKLSGRQVEQRATPDLICSSARRGNCPDEFAFYAVTSDSVDLYKLESSQRSLSLTKLLLGSLN